MFGHDMAMNQTCYGLHSKFDAPRALYCHARHIIEKIVQSAHGSIFSTITTATFEATKVVLPSKHLLLAFEERMKPVFAQILTNLHQSRSLAAVRDSLLPRLLSGEADSKCTEPGIESAFPSQLEIPFEKGNKKS